MADPARASSYDAVAESYDLGRPGYPEELIEDTVRLSNIPPAGRILEIGCGTGQATRPFARRGYRMVCLEPGPHLARLARKNLSGYPGVSVREERLEDWPLEAKSFDLILAATSLHHVSPDVRYTRSARALKTGGSLAVFANHPGREDPGFRAELDEIYLRWRGPEEAKHFAEQTLERRIKCASDEIDQSGFFGGVETVRHPWTVEFDIPRYMAILDSDSGRLKHPPESQEGLKRDIASAITRRGGTVRRGYVAVLHLARWR